MNYEAIFVDWDGTLSDSKFWDRWRDDPRRADKYQRIQKALFESTDGRILVNKWMTGSRSYGDILSYLSDSAGIYSSYLEEELRYSAENMQFIDTSVLPMIQRLREIGKQVVVATDNMDTFNLWTTPALGLHDHFDDVLNSASIGYLKKETPPIGNSSVFFNRYLNEMGIPAENTVLIDNSLDAKSLEKSGINFLHVTKNQPLAYHLENILNNS